MTKANNDNQNTAFKDDPWTSNTNPIWLGSTLKFFRNIEKFHFPTKLDAVTIPLAFIFPSDPIPIPERVDCA